MKFIANPLQKQDILDLIELSISFRSSSELFQEIIPLCITKPILRSEHPQNSHKTLSLIIPPEKLSYGGKKGTKLYSET